MTHLRGKFIVLEGGEGCGKSTQMALLRDALLAAGVDLACVRDPGSTRIGELIRAILLDPDHTEMNLRTETLLYMAARAQMMAQTIGPALEAGRTVLSDRFVSSTLAYQLGGDGLTAAEIREVARVALRGRLPDLTIILDLDVDAAHERLRPKLILFPDDPDTATKDRIERRPIEYHRAVRLNYLAQVAHDPDRYAVVDASRGVEEVHARVMTCLNKLAGRVTT